MPMQILMLMLLKNRNKMETIKLCSHNWMSADSTLISWQDYQKMYAVRSNRTHNLLLRIQVNQQILIHLLKLNLDL